MLWRGAKSAWRFCGPRCQEPLQGDAEALRGCEVGLTLVSFRYRFSRRVCHDGMEDIGKPPEAWMDAREVGGFPVEDRNARRPTIDHDKKSRALEALEVS